MRNTWLASTLAALTLALGCDPGQGAAAPCPPCECKCDCSTADAPNQQATSTQPPSTQPSADHRAELTELVTSANRKLMHGDGVGCLADLDRIDKLDPVLGKQLVITRAQCRMAKGECQPGKQQLVEWYMREQAFTREFAEKAAESIASMRCRGGDATDRDRLLAALFDLSDGAYMNKRDVGFCKARLAIVESLAPKVKPRNAEDTQVSGGIQALFHTSAMCFARAGDCREAYVHYRRLFPADGLSAISDPTQRESVVRSSFDSSISLCQP